MKDACHVSEAQYNEQQDLPRSKHAEQPGDAEYLFSRFLSGTEKGLQLQFEPSAPLSFGRNWLAIDPETIERGASESCKVSLELEDGYFDKVLCTGLDRVARPASLIMEMRRVLKRGGQIWVQAPLNSAYSPEADDPPYPVYWQFTPRGFQVLLQRFDEIMCSACPTDTLTPQQDSFFYGVKPLIPNEKAEDSAHPSSTFLPL